MRILGLTESGREGDSVYLRAWDDYEFHTLKLTASATTGIAHVGYRAASQPALERQQGPGSAPHHFVLRRVRDDGWGTDRADPV